jgi:signal transduction histidine kinase
MTAARLGQGTIRIKLLAAFASTLLILVVVWIGVAAITRTEAAHYWADHAVMVRAHAHAILKRLLEARLARSTYVISGDPNLLRAARNLRTVTTSEMSALSTLSADNPEQLTRLMAMAPFLELEVAGMEESLRYADEDDLDALTSIVLQNLDRTNFARLDEALDAVAAEEDKHIVTRTSIARQRTDTARILLIVGGSAAFLLMIFVINQIRVGVRDRESAHATIAEQARALALRGQQLERSLKELDEFAYVASHDLKAPLRAIASLASWIQEDSGDKLDDEGREHLQLMVSRVARMEALVEGVLAYARAGRSPHATETVDVGELVAEVIDLLEPPADVTISIEGVMPKVEVVRVPFQQVWMNLVSNAIKHGGQPGRIRIGVADNGAEPRYYVADAGPGIEPQYHERIFGLFQTLASRDRVESTGIGLAVVKKLVENQGGKVWVESAAGDGTTFHFTYPPSEAG